MIPFNLPIFYNKDKCELKPHVIADLELVEPIETGPCMYDFVIGTSAKSSPFSRNLIPQVAQYYTTNTTFLKQTQNLINKFVSVSFDNSFIKILRFLFFVEFFFCNPYSFL